MLVMQVFVVSAKLGPCCRAVGEGLSESIILGSATLLRILREAGDFFKNAGHVGCKDAA